MDWSRLISLWKKEWLLLWREPLLILVFFSAVTLQLIVFGYSTDSRMRNVPLYYDDEDQTETSRSWLSSLGESGTFTLIPTLHSGRGLTDAVEKGKAVVGLKIPSDFTSQIISGKPPPLRIFLDGTVSNTALLAKNILIVKLENFQKIPPGPRLKGKIKIPPNPELKDAFFNMPGFLGTILCILVTALAATWFSREREFGTLSSLQVTPVRYWEFFLGKAVPLFLLASFHALVGYMVASWVFQIPMGGSLSLLGFATACFILLCIAIGFLAACFSHTQYQASITSMLIVLPEVFLSAGMGPSENWPTWLQTLAWFNPLFYYVRLSRNSWILHQGWLEQWPLWTLLLGATLLFLGISLRQAKSFYTGH